MVQWLDHMQEDSSRDFLLFYCGKNSERDGEGYSGFGLFAQCHTQCGRVFLQKEEKQLYTTLFSDAYLRRFNMCEPVLNCM
ncbi:hypothetical protein SAMN02745702_00550 [Desulfobaculum bizertense DSM 18034]|uniref:Uncharacterized protein n=1 Tax=Desulfobaculum bizertense DSM 18034 TaxID=1121442 RepID=A0A1T4VLK4_9BACT|nr:hypothetical protein SAMN02745702_00550 [Desulfobaculum bizertense DSM 18034]